MAHPHLPTASLTPFTNLQSSTTQAYLLYTITPPSNLITLTSISSPKTEDYQTFLSELPDNECRYGIYNFGNPESQSESKEGEVSTTIVFIIWLPDGANVMERELFLEYSSVMLAGFEGLKDAVRVEASEKGVLQEEGVRRRVGL
ncbi:hypothetical protein TWF730_001098 [Orbilia blumenaviensis]|uniref:Cofilin n=1 Tax=Orbilia blumenaviensis TaxID=1796055 RepID=A0AAV9VQS3_9PEZI